MANALILVDIQNDFLPGGALAVADGDQVIGAANQLIAREFDFVIATQDWHPANHKSFASNNRTHRAGDVIDLNGLPQVLWPDHCIQNSDGAKFPDGLALPDNFVVFQKGTNTEIDSYSGFFDNGHRQATGLGDYLRNQHVQQVYIMGLATDYCVKFTALDAKQLGFDTFLVLPGCRGVELKVGDVDSAVEEMADNGIEIYRNFDF